MYRNDSFFDLSFWERIGLVGISAALAILALLLTWRLLCRRPVLLRVAGALALFWVFVWVSPQVYYSYYRIIIPDLPLQWVIWPPASPVEAVKMLVFSGPSNLSAHGQGVLGWAMIVAPWMGGRRR